MLFEAMPRRIGVRHFLVPVFAAMILTGCAQDVPPFGCENPHFDCFSEQALKGIKVVRENVSYWSTVQFIAQIIIVLSGIVATIMIALQGDDNRYLTRPVGLVATALVTGATSALVSFHVPENIDKLIDSMDKMATIANEYGRHVGKLKAGRSDNEIEEAYKNDPAFREAAIDLTFKFVTEWNKSKIEMLRLSGSASRLNASNSKSDSGPKSDNGSKSERPGN